jgi:cation diffusion facilitator CzcD-associated flavoprotein CzcO
LTGVSVQTRSVTATDIFLVWLDEFGAALGSCDIQKVLPCFDAGGYWKDILAFTWGYRTFSGVTEIRDGLAPLLPNVKPNAIKLAKHRTAPRFGRRSSQNVIEGYFDFETQAGHGSGFVRLLHDADNPFHPKIWLLLTTLQELRGFEEKIGARRASGDDYAQNRVKGNWQDARDTEKAFVDRDPDTLIVGAGHAGLTLAARLKLMGSDALVIEKNPRLGDVWRNRYHSLTLHNQVFANHMAFMPFPESWPTWLPKDKLAGWLEYYAEAMDLNVWTGTELLHATYDDQRKQWSACIRLADGADRVITCKHLVLATGVSGSIPKRPPLPGLETFQGTVMHSAEFTSGAEFTGKTVVVVGTGNSGHDVAQDLCMNDAAKVYMLQRAKTCVVSLEPTAISTYSIYSEGRPVDDVDLVGAALPYPVLEDSYKWLTKKGAANDRELLQKLNAVGFSTFFGDDETGFQMMYLRGEGGYYINVGCSDLIVDGSIGILQFSNLDRFTHEGLRMKDGSVIACDAVVLATGFQNMQENIRKLLGSDIAERIGPIWGFDRNYIMRNVWQATAQQGFWVMGGAFIDARLFSRFLAIQIIASLNGLFPPDHR